MDELMITLTRDQLKKLVKEAATEAIHEHENRRTPHGPDHLFNRNQAARLLGKSFTTVSRMIETGRITATADGKYIARRELDRYQTSS